MILETPFEIKNAFRIYSFHDICQYLMQTINNTLQWTDKERKRDTKRNKKKKTVESFTKNVEDILSSGRYYSVAHLIDEYMEKKLLLDYESTAETTINSKSAIAISRLHIYRLNNKKEERKIKIYIYIYKEAFN